MLGFPSKLDGVHKDAYAAFDRGELGAALPLFQRLAEADPKRYAYMLGLVHKYRREWRQSIEHNLRSIAAKKSDDGLEAEHWNTAIAATALGEWSLAREHWIAAGVNVAPGHAPMDEERGLVSVRINAWAAGETLFARRIGLARARLLNIPLPSSGHRYGDIVLIDGASTGYRSYGESTVPVFNELERLIPSEFLTFEARIDCASAEHAEALEDSTGPDVGIIEDWTRSMVFHCMKCSYGLPHDHAERDPDESGWIRERHVGIAATSRHAVEQLLDAWLKQGGDGSQRPNRAVLELELCENPEPPLSEEGTWWVGPEDEPGDEQTGA